MPQLDFGNPMTISQVVWMFIIFAVLYLLLSRWALPKVAEVVDARSTRLTADLETARETKAQADAAIAELTEATRRAHAEAQGAIAAAIAAAKAEAAGQARTMNEALDRKLAAAEAEIAKARAAAMGSLRQVAAETTQLVISRLTGHGVDPNTLHAAVDQALATQQAA